jgi:5-methylcytosine-specific restriction endonuclease McrA
MPRRPPRHRPPGWRRAKRGCRDAVDRGYGAQAWRKLAAAVIARDGGVCCLCGQSGADTAHHVVEKRKGGSDDLANLRAVHRGCHNRLHRRRGATP